METDIENTAAPSVGVPRMVRPCVCPQVAEYGYELQVWVGGRKSWRYVGNYPNADAVKEAAKPFSHVLIRCRGCGKEQVREMGLSYPGRLRIFWEDSEICGVSLPKRPANEEELKAVLQELLAILSAPTIPDDDLDGPNEKS